MTAAIEAGPCLRGAQQRQAGARRQPGGVAPGLAGERHQCLQIVEQRVGNMHRCDALLFGDQFCGRQARLQLRDHVAPFHAAQQLAFRRRVRVAEFDAHQEAVELRFRQRKGADLVGRILRRDDEERLGQHPRLALDRDLAFFHRLQQSALALG